MNTLTFFALLSPLASLVFSVFGFVAEMLGVEGSIMGRSPRRPTNVGEKRGTAAPTI
jgi:hypothetical protein